MRQPPATSRLARYVQWDGETLGPWTRELENAAALINLSGRSVNCRYNDRNRRDILESRLRPTHVLGQAVVLCADPPKVWLNSSSATIYRHALDRPMDESAGEIGEGFSVDVCQQWEKMFFDCPLKRTRKARAAHRHRPGPHGGPAFQAFHRLVKFGLGGKMGSGRQFVSWLHADDFAGAVNWLIGQGNLSGPINLAAPNPLTNRDFMRVLRKVSRRPIGLPAAVWMLRLGALLLGTETELLLKSRAAVVPARLLASGYRFKFANWQEAAQNIVRQSASAPPTVPS